MQLAMTKKENEELTMKILAFNYNKEEHNAILFRNRDEYASLNPAFLQL